MTVGREKDRLGRSPADLSYLLRVDAEQQRLAREERELEVRDGWRALIGLVVVVWIAAQIITRAF